MWNEIRGFLAGRKNSREEAKGRLHLMLAHDRAGIEGARLQELRNEIAAVISKYVPIDPACIEIQVERITQAGTQLTVSTPLRPRSSEP